MGKAQETRASPNDLLADRLTVLDFFKRHFMYSERSTHQIKKLIPCLSIQKFAEGEIILKEGDVGDAIYIVGTGTVELWTLDSAGSKKVSIRLGENEVLGERSFVNSRHLLTQSVSAYKPTTLFVLKRATYEEVKNQNFMEPIKTRVEFARKLLIRQSLKKLPFLANVTDKELADIDNYFVFEEIRKGNRIFEQGDVGDKFYVLVAGKTVVTTKDDLGFIIEVARLNPVSSFGEQALITEEERNATVTTLEDCQFFTLSKKEFQIFLKKTPEARVELANAVKANKAGNYFSDNIPIFQSMSKRHQHLLGVVSDLIKVDPNTIIKQEGTMKNQNFYLIVVGKCNVYVGEEFIKALVPGDYFGEVALVSNEPSTATVKTSEEPEGCTLMTVSKEDFLNIFADEPAFLSELKIRLDGANCSLEDILKHPKGRESFLRHCQQEFAKENVDFWQDVLALENIQSRRVRKSVLLAMNESIPAVKQRKAELLEKKANMIYHKYLEPDSPEEVNLPAEVKSKLLNRFEKNDLSYDMFDEARKSIYEMIEADNFQRYKASDAFQALIRQIGIYKRGSVHNPRDNDMI